MGMMGGAFKRAGKDDEKGPKEDKKKDKGKGGPPRDDKKGKGGPPPRGQKHADKNNTTERGQVFLPKVQVALPDARTVTPAVIVERSRPPVGISRMSSITDQVICRQQDRKTLNPVLLRGSRRASVPALMADPFLSPHDTRGAHEKNASLKMRRKSTELPYRRRSLNVVVEDEYVKDPLECLLPVYEHKEKLNITPTGFAIKFSMYLDSTCIGFIVGILLALIVKGILVLLDKAI